MKKLVLSTLFAIGLIGSVWAQTFQYQVFNENFWGSSLNTNNWTIILPSTNSSFDFSTAYYVSGTSSGYASSYNVNNGISLKEAAQIVSVKQFTNFPYTVSGVFNGSCRPYLFIRTDGEYYAPDGNPQGIQFWFNGDGGWVNPQCTICQSSGYNTGEQIIYTNPSIAIDFTKPVEFSVTDYGTNITLFLNNQLFCSVPVTTYSMGGSVGFASWWGDPNGVTLNRLTVSVPFPPVSITIQPTNVSLTATNSQTATFSVVATNGVPPYAYQWMKDGVDLTNQTNASLILSNAAANTVGYYSCDVTDQNGTTVTSSNAALNINGIDFNLWQGLVAYYPFNGNANDGSGLAEPVKLSPSASFVTGFGNKSSLNIAGKGFFFRENTAELPYLDKSNAGEFVDIPAPKINNKNTFSASIWINQNGMSHWHGESYLDAGYSSQSINLVGDFYLDSIKSTVSTSSGITLNDPLESGKADVNISDIQNKWINYIVVCNNDTIDTYKNALKLYSAYITNTPSGDWSIGRHWWDHGDTFSTRLIALVANVRIYNRALSSNEVSALFQAEAPVPTNNQTITFPTIPAKAYGTAPFALTATSSAGTNYPITYSSSDPTIATVSSNKVKITGVGSCLITASQPGDFIYKAATNVSRTLTVTQGSQTIPFSAPASRSYSTSTFTLPLNSSAGLPVIYTSSSSAVATISGNVVTITGPGSTVITATQDGNANYKAAPTVNQTLVVSQAAQTITFPAIASKAYGAPSFNLTATATSGLPVTYSSSNTNVATVSGNTVTIRGVGSTTITASQAGNANYVAAPSVGQALTVTKAAQTITFTAPTAKTYGDSSFSLSAVASSGLSVTFTSANTNVATISGSTVNIVGAGTASITATQSGNANYNAATSVAKTLTVAKAAQTVSFNPTTPVTYVKNGTFSLSASSTSGGTISFTSGNTAILTISGKTATMKAKGTVSVTASAAATTNYNAASKTNSITLQ
jgi:uncharacterized protein YjdB